MDKQKLASRVSELKTELDKVLVNYHYLRGAAAFGEELLKQVESEEVTAQSKKGKNERQSGASSIRPNKN